MHPHIRKYRHAHAKTIRFSGSTNEQNIRSDFINLINDFADERNLRLVPELRDKSNNTIPDGTLKDRYQCTYGYYEAKDQHDNLDDEIQQKLKLKGYSSENILFENSQIAVLYQENKEVDRVDIQDDEGLEKIIHQFLNFKRTEIEDFEKAIQTFKENVPELTQALRKLIDQAQAKPQFTHARDQFLARCQNQINPKIIKEDIREMIIQHFLTGKLFQTVFSEGEFHHDNHIARQINNLCWLAFDRKIRKDFMARNAHFYHTLEVKAKSIRDHHDKQGFLKTLYEEFYKAYNPKAADRLGVVYTPTEIVKFIIESTDQLLYKHFQTTLAQPDVNILDPATGTGTFIADLIDYLPPSKLKYKYQNEIFANEIAILPYYIAALNIEYTYQQKMSDYQEFSNLTFVDTLENYSALQDFTGAQTLQFGLTEENKAALQRQNEAKISVIMGNPPYNANQQNYNDQNANRNYEEIDKRIKRTFAKRSTAQKLKLEDMYVRFYRWAMDRLDPEKGGIVAFVTNNSFLTARGFDGFRRCVFEDFDYIYVVDLGGNIRASYGKRLSISNVFNIQVGVCIAFFVRTPKRNQRQKLFYYGLEDGQAKAEKLLFLKTSQIEDLDFDLIYPDKHHHWLNLTDNNFEDLLPLCSKQVKNAQTHEEEDALFKLFTNGVVTARDAWVYDFDKSNLRRKVKYLSQVYNRSIRKRKMDEVIKWSHGLAIHFDKKDFSKYASKYFMISLYRPFTKRHYYSAKLFSDRLTENHYEMFGKHGELENIVIQFSGFSHLKPFHCLATNMLPCLDNVEKGQCLPLYRYDSEGKQIDNITDWGLQQFQNHYQNKDISKLQIFYYVYAVLHCPQYRKTYKFNLKHNFPRIPFYRDFSRWADMGKNLMDLHIDFEQIEPYSLKRHDLNLDSVPLIRPKLKADRQVGKIFIDDQTTLSEIPKAAWAYKLGNRSALEWVLDQYKEKKIRDKTVAEKFNAYKFADYKEEVILLLRRVCRVSVETVGIIDSM